MPNFRKQLSRPALLPGMNVGAIDPTGFSYIDKNSLGVDGQGYGLASFKKGLHTMSTCDILKANASQIALKEHRAYN